jgi:hypothetical protein
MSAIVVCSKELEKIIQDEKNDLNHKNSYNNPKNAVAQVSNNYQLQKNSSSGSKIKEFNDYAYGLDSSK